MKRSHLLLAVSLLLLTAQGTAQCGRAHVHQALLDLLAPHEADRVAVRDGSWSWPATWAGGEVPRDGDRVYVPPGITVKIGRQLGARLDVVRIDGELIFDPTADTRLLAETVLSAPTGRFTMGTADHPVRADRTAEVVILGQGPFDAVRDPEQIGRGLVLHGPASLVGSPRVAWLPVEGDQRAGDRELSVALPAGETVPRGWEVGDELVLGGTWHDWSGSDADDTRFHDERLRLLAIAGSRLTFERIDVPGAGLRFDHVRPQSAARWLMRGFVGNLTRNVIVRSERPHATPQDRGHVMFMHTTEVLVQHAGFRHLGRSDKQRNVDDPIVNVNGEPGQGTNPRGRYAVHFHRNLPAQPPLPAGCQPAVIRGCAVLGSPGWGIVHHDSHVLIEGNFVHDIGGAGIVAEAGNEIGRWSDNLVIKVRGLASGDRHQEINPRLARYDFGFVGEGYWLQGSPRIAFERNVAMSCAGPGVALFTFADAIAGARDARVIHREDLAPELRHIVTVGDRIDATHTPMETLREFEVVNSHQGFLSWHHHRNDDGQDGYVCPCDGNVHRERTRVSGFVFWGIYGDGIFTQYTTQMDFEWGVVVGDPANPVPVRLADDGAGRGHGISQNGPAQGLRYSQLWVEGFERGMRIPVEGREQDPPEAARATLGSEMHGSHFENCSFVFSRRQVPWIAPDPFPDNFRADGVTVRGALASAPPIATFNARSIGDEGVVRLDASASWDPDPDPSLTLAGDGIAIYSWDTDADGRDDAWGRVVHLHRSNRSSFPVRLTVRDHQGVSATSILTVVQQPVPYEDAVVNGDFSDPGPFFPGWQLATARAGDGWSVRDARVESGALRFVGQRWGVTGAAQIIHDDHVRRGLQTLRLNLRNTEGDARANDLRVEVWGVDGEFDGSAEGDGPLPIGAVPMTPTLLWSGQWGGSSFGWTAVTATVDFGAGYEFLYLQVRGRGIEAAAGDDVRIDDVSLTDG